MVSPRIGGQGVVTAKGDIMAYNGADMERLPVGPDGSWLEADSTQTTGLRWANSGPTTDVDIYVDIVGGSDITGDGSIGNPYQDYPRAVEDINVERLGITFIHLKPGVYTGVQLPATRGPVIVYADEVWDPAVFIDVFTGVTDAGTDANGITDAGLVADAFNDTWLEVNGEKKQVLVNTTTRISPCTAFQTAFGAGVNYRIFASDVRIVFTAAAFNDYNYVAVGTGARGTSALLGKEQNPYVAFVGVTLGDAPFFGGNLVFAGGQYAAFGLRVELSDFANWATNIDAADMWCGDHYAALQALDTRTSGASLLWLGWGFISTGDGAGSGDLGAIAVTGNGAVFGVFSCAFIGNRDYASSRYSPAQIEWYGGRIRIAEFWPGSLLTVFGSAVVENRPIFGGPNIAPNVVVNMLGGGIDLDNVRFVDFGVGIPFIATRSSSRIRITSTVTGAAVGANTVEIQGVSALVSDGAPALGGAGNDWKVGTAAAFNKAALAAVNANVASIGSIALRQT